MRFSSSIAAGFLIATCASTSADTISGLVVGVSDGDTITLLDAQRMQHKVRLSGIDAPEKQQAFGNRSKQSLTDLAYRKHATVETSKSDRYGRIVGKVIVKDLDVNLEQVRLGMAWHYKAYEREQHRADRLFYAAAEDAAKASGAGLWAMPSPTPPWEFRLSESRIRAAAAVPPEAGGFNVQPGSRNSARPGNQSDQVLVEVPASREADQQIPRQVVGAN
jgi:endonuclease YncB( thermonuclease family)